jgi:hypothetical protein
MCLGLDRQSSHSQLLLGLSVTAAGGIGDTEPDSECNWYPWGKEDKLLMEAGNRDFVYLPLPLLWTLSSSRA